MWITSTVETKLKDTMAFQESFQLASTYMPKPKSRNQETSSSVMVYWFLYYITGFFFVNSSSSWSVFSRMSRMFSRIKKGSTSYSQKARQRILYNNKKMCRWMQKKKNYRVLKCARNDFFLRLNYQTEWKPFLWSFFRTDTNTHIPSNSHLSVKTRITFMEYGNMMKKNYFLCNPPYFEFIIWYLSFLRSFSQ